MIRKTLILLFISVILISPVQAAGNVQFDAYGIPELEEAIPDAAADIVGDIGVEDAVNAELLLEKLWEGMKAAVEGMFAAAFRNGVAVLAVVLLCGLLAQFAFTQVPKYINIVGVLGISVIIVGDSGSVIQGASEALQSMTDFSHLMLPSLCAAATASGALSSATAKFAATALFMDIFMTLSFYVIIPLIFLYLAASVSAAALDSSPLRGAASLIKWLCTMSITLVMSAFTLYLTITGAITGATDALALKATKTAMSTALPVVGGIVSDAADTVLVGAGMIRSAVGVFGVLIVVAICIGPFAALGCKYLVYKAAAAVAESFSQGRMSDVISSVGTAFGMALGLVGSGAVMLFLSIVSMIRAVSL